MVKKSRQPRSRIPIRFLDAEGKDGSDAATAPDGEPDDGGLTPEEIGRSSSYEDETEVRRRIDRGAEDDSTGGREQADDADAAGAPHPLDLPEHREDQDTRAMEEDGTDDGLNAPEDAGNSSPEAAPRSSTTTTDPASGPMLAELIATRAELRRLETELKNIASERADERQEYLEKLARRQADFENYRKRVERERGETYNQIVGEVVSHLLPVMDNLRRALDAEASVEASESKEFRHFLHGVELINKQLNSVLESMGIETVATVGQPFDPHVHEAVAIEQTDRFEPDIVMEEIARGYRLGDKLLRPAIVKVAAR